VAKTRLAHSVTALATAIFLATTFAMGADIFAES
jgi:hypothetical protein